ncbi:hypothetical protein [Pelomonas cellulosilytica]|uniref:Uncharacterized protein n=1 Tax=Pelomonas cellulosilytica TaxID=2906762 RepID=A0ABS8XNE2_9BURK|nr:hypothetical protein [Pelomonas sp. P8]MCE4554282.1 hypothetical protein [Pelomonas sp. P8]
MQTYRPWDTSAARARLASAAACTDETRSVSFVTLPASGLMQLNSARPASSSSSMRTMARLTSATVDLLLERAPLKTRTQASQV